MDLKRLLVLVVALLAIGLDALSASGSTGPPKPAPTLTKKSAVVDHVADGDTIAVRIGGHDEDVRFIGIDTPEVYFGVECAGPEASASMKRMLEPGDRVGLIRDRSQANRDRYGRLLRYVESRGRDLGRKQVRKGWASVYVYDNVFHRLSSYRRAAKKARHGDRGAWQLCGGF